MRFSKLRAKIRRQHVKVPFSTDIGSVGSLQPQPTQPATPTITSLLKNIIRVTKKLK